MTVIEFMTFVHDNYKDEITATKALWLWSMADSTLKGCNQEELRIFLDAFLEKTL